MLVIDYTLEYSGMFSYLYGVGPLRRCVINILIDACLHLSVYSSSSPPPKKKKKEKERGEVYTPPANLLDTGPVNCSVSPHSGK